MGSECGSRLFNKIEARQARDTDDLQDDTLARADSGRAGTRWLRTEIIGNLGGSQGEIRDVVREWNQVG